MAKYRATGQTTLFNVNDAIADTKPPANPKEGSLWYNTTDNKFYIYTNGEWKFAAEGMQIGGRNILKNGAFKGSTSWRDWGSNTIGTRQLVNITDLPNITTGFSFTATVKGEFGYAQDSISVIKDETYTLSAWVFITTPTGSIKVQEGNSTVKWTSTATSEVGKWVRVKHTFVAKDTTISVYVGQSGAADVVCSGIVTGVQLERGNVLTDFNSSPEDTQGQIDEIKDSVDSIGADGKITRFERSLVRGYIADIIGKYLNPTDAMPTIDQIDNNNYNAGKLYAIRMTARKIGLNTTASANYKPLGAAYTALVTYLTGLNPKPWDTSATGNINIDRNVWNAKWNDYYNRYALFEIEVQDRQKEFTEQETQKMSKDTIAAISTTGNYDKVTFANPVNIKPPISTLGLPEFEGRHADSWKIEGVNLIENSTFNKGMTGWSGNYTVIAPESDKSTSSIMTISRSGETTNRNAQNWCDAIEVFADGTKEFTVSFDMKTTDFAAIDSASSFTTLFCIRTFNDPTKTAQTDSVWYQNVDKKDVTLVNNEWLRINLTIKPTGGQYIKVAPYLTRNGTLFWREIQLAYGNKVTPWSLTAKEQWAGAGNRIRPVTNPLFTSGTDLTIWGKFYGDGTNNDKFYWNTNGAAIKEKRWMDISLNDKQTWTFSNAATGLKRVRADGFSYANATSTGAMVVKSDGTILTNDGNLPVNTFSTSANLDRIWLSIDNNESGWGEAYKPTKEEISAYFLGWRMCDGKFGGLYGGSGIKMWYPVGDKDLSRATVAGNTAPTEPSPSISDKTINYYQVVYRLVDAVQETVDFDGILELLATDNVVTTYYPTLTTPITTGTIKFGINLATVNQDTRYIIPSMVKRLSNAEQKITDDSITNTVFNSREYTLALKNKANASDLGNLATKDELGNVAGGVDGKIKDAMDKLDFTPYATKSELKQTATDITAKFSATGGMNLIKNSIGYSDLDFWTLINSYKVETVSNSALDNLGFGKGFYFKANGQQQGITQDISVIPGQPYTLGWYLNKMTKGGDTNYRFWIQAQEYNGSDWVIIDQIADNKAVTTNGFEARYMVFTPTKDKVRIRFIGYQQVEAIVSGIMLNIGDVALQWTLATGELYNTNIRMNINGIRVSQLDSNGSEVGYTQITPSEFAGYYQNNGKFEKVFYLNGDETVTKKLRATDEITLGNIKILSIQSKDSTGWAFVSNKL